MTIKNLRNKITIAIALITCFALLGGCTRALVTKYSPGVELEENHISGKKIAVYEFEDDRAWIEKNNKKSSSFIAQQGTWKFGMKYENVEYHPVSLVLQDIMIKEFNYIGVEAFKGGDDLPADYKLKGRILNFEFENETGVFTVTSRRHVSLSLTLLDANGNKILSNEVFNKADRENEGMGVMHSTNVEKLMDGTLKEVILSVINRTNEELSKQGIKTLAVSLNGVTINPLEYDVENMIVATKQ